MNQSLQASQQSQMIIMNSIKELRLRVAKDKKNESLWKKKVTPIFRKSFLHRPVGEKTANELTWTTIHDVENLESDMRETSCEEEKFHGIGEITYRFG